MIEGKHIEFIQNGNEIDGTTFDYIEIEFNHEALVFIEEAIDVKKELLTSDQKIGFGTVADIFADKEFKNNFCIKRNTRPNKIGMNAMEEECRIQAKACAIVKNAKQRNEDTAQIPEPQSFFKKNGEEYMMMEIINGKTIYRLQLENAARTIGIGFNDKMSDIDLFTILKTIIKPKFKRSGEKEDIAYLRSIREICTANPFLTEEQSNKIERTIKLLNSEGLYHRDLHNQNIMIDNDGIPYIIDFGTSIYQPGLSPEFAYDLDGSLVADPDTNIISFLRDSTIYPNRLKQDQKIINLREKLPILAEKYPILADIMIKLDDGALQNFESVLQLISQDGTLKKIQLELYSSKTNNLIELAEALTVIEHGLSGTTDKTKAFLKKMVDSTFIDSNKAKIIWNMVNKNINL